MSDPLTAAAGNGLLHRRHLLKLGLAGAGSLLASGAAAQDSMSRLQIPEWSRRPGPGQSGYGQPSAHVADIRRLATPASSVYPGGGASRTPLHQLQGTITPNSLHFERHHAGVPEIDPAGHQLVLHGLVRQPLVFGYEDLLRYPMISRVQFLECSGNSRVLLDPEPVDGTAGSIHGLVSCAEWTGIPLNTLLEEAGVTQDARWLLAVGADGASMGRSIPLDKALDDVMVALYQNGEPLRPEQGYPMRLFVPGWEGNISVKWLTQLKLAREPGQFRDETSKYTDTMPDRRSHQFTFPMGVKSVITSPSGQMRVGQPGIYQISGLAWSGGGRIRRVEVSADGGSTWAEAELEAQHGSPALSRFRIPWNWQGGTAMLLSRATDERGQVQPSREAVLERQGRFAFYHNNCIQSWGVSADGEVRNAFV